MAMKTKLSLIILFLFTNICILFSQVPQGFNYQAIARDGSGNVLANTTLQVMIYIRSSSTGGTLFWQELHNPVETNSLGLFNIVLGTGVRQTASSVAAFNLIDWKTAPKYLQAEVYFSGSWRDMGAATQLYSVPYAMAAQNLTGTEKLNIKGSTSNLEEALFEVKNKDGQTIFAVYNEGVRIYVDDGAKGSKGGFAVGGFDMTKLTRREYLIVSDDSIRMYLDSNIATKGKKGGFAVGGFDMTKAGLVQNYLDVSADSARIYVKNTAKGAKGGFAVGGFDQTKNYTGNYLDLTPKNSFIGEGSGAKNVSGVFNSFIGYQTGASNTDGGNNAFLGYQSGYKNTTGSNNLFLGYQSGFNNTAGNYNSFAGYQAGYANTTGANNTFMGSFSGSSNIYGSDNTFLGYNAGKLNQIGSANNFIGTGSGLNNTSGNYNVFLGTESGASNTEGSLNIMIGFRAGYENKSGSENVFLGNSAGYKSNSLGNVFIGWGTGRENTSGYENVFVGLNAGVKNTTSGANTYVGSSAGTNFSGDHNTFIGFNAGFGDLEGASGYSNAIVGETSGAFLTTGYSNSFLGARAGFTITSGYCNVFLGQAAGYQSKGSGNIFIGYTAGYPETDGNNKLYIENSNADSNNALIYGEFDNDMIRLNGTVNIRDVLKLKPQKDAPATASEGDMYYNSTLHKLMVFDGNEWRACW
jgi:hypothetical protein